MKVVVDANILIAALIKEGKTAELLINPSISLFAPAFIKEEILKYRDEISSKTHRPNQVEDILEEILSIIRIIPKSKIESFISKARKFSPDPKDDVYLALALMLNCPIWSNDKKLKSQDFVKVCSTEEIIDLIDKY